jgi:xanthine dehydrogenase accessory factor
MVAGEDFLGIKQQLLNEGRRFAVISLVNTQTSVPQQAPQNAEKLILCESGQFYGSLGSREFEMLVIEQAKACLASRCSKFAKIDEMLQRVDESFFDSTKRKMEVFIEVYEPPPKLIIIGAEDISLATAIIAQNLDFKIIILDERSDIANKNTFPMADSIICEPNLEQALSPIIDQSSYIVINSQINYERAVRYCLGKEWAYCGILGSKRKMVSLRNKLIEDGFSTEQIDRINAPIGLEIGAQTQYEIAISIIAEIIAVRHNKKAVFMKSLM